jgi:hypothetical protein
MYICILKPLFLCRRARKRSLLGQLFRLTRTHVVLQSTAALGGTVLYFGGPFFLNRILTFVAAADAPVTPASLLNALALFLCTTCRSLCDGQTYFNGRRIGTRIRGALIAEVYKKAQTRATCAPAGPVDTAATVGQITNLMAVDTQKILETSCYLHYTWTTPLQVVLSVSLLLYVLGWPALAGVAVMVVMVPIGGALGRVIQGRQKELMKTKDARITKMNEVPPFILLPYATA